MFERELVWRSVIEAGVESGGVVGGYKGFYRFDELAGVGVFIPPDLLVFEGFEEGLHGSVLLRLSWLAEAVDSSGAVNAASVLVACVGGPSV